MSYRILVADDEPLARDDVLYTLRGALGDACAFYEAANGRQALALAREICPDMIVIDVAMPLMSGLDVMKTLRGEGWRGAFLIISGFSDFQYAQTAVRLGACDYLLKPIDADALRAAARGLLDKISSERERRRVEKSLYLENALHRVVSGGACPDAFDEFPSRVAMALAQTPASRSRNSILFSAADTYSFPSALNANRAVFLSFADTDEAARVALLRTLESLPADCRAAFAWGAPARDMPSLLEQCRDALCARFATDERPILRAASFARHAAPPSPPPPDQCEAMDRLLRAFSDAAELPRAECDALVRAAFLPRGVPSDRAMRASCARLLAALPSEKRARDPLAGADTMDELCREMYDLLRAAAPMDPGDIHGIVMAVGEYLDGHFAEPVTLREMAQRFSLNQNYLSAAFKEHTGVNFIDYLSARRMDAAKRLLMESEQSVSRIAERTGWRSSSYFQRVFKKKEGVTPIEYRARRAP